MTPMNRQEAQTEEQLRAEIESLKRQLAAAGAGASHGSGHGADAAPRGPSAGTLLTVLLLVAALALAGYFLGYLPRQRREQVLAAESRADQQSLPVENVQLVERSAASSSLVLPGNIQAVTEAPVLARATGYIRKRYADIGDRVAAGQVLAEIEAPELAQQIKQAQAAIDQANSSVQQAEAALQQGRANANLARVTSERWTRLLAKGAVSHQEADNYQAQYEAQQANVQALEKAVAAARSNAAAAQANLDRLHDLFGYLTVRAPFAGVITVRNIDNGALVNEGSTLLYRIAQTGRLRTYLNVPQADAESVRVGQRATLEIPDLPGRKFEGTVTRTANALDPASRTLLVEVEVPNPAGTLLPGMYAQVDLAVPRQNPPPVIPADTLVVRSDGPQVAVIGEDGAVHYTHVQLGRDLGEYLEALSGVEPGQRLAVNPGDSVREGARVKPVMAPGKKK